MRKGAKSIDDNASQGDMLGRVRSKKRRVCLFGKVDEACAKRVIEELKAYNKENCHKKIFLFINSTGGDDDAGYRIAKAICVLKAPVYGIVIWSACSAAFDVLQACKKRIACNNKSIVMCHGVALDDIRIDQVDRDEMIKKAEDEHDYYLCLVVARSNGKITLEELRKLSQKEENIYACRARHLGLLDRVVYKKKKKSKKRLDI